jgi:hypothetical protein
MDEFSPKLAGKEKSVNLLYLLLNYTSGGN